MYRHVCPRLSVILLRIKLDYFLASRFLKILVKLMNIDVPIEHSVTQERQHSPKTHWTAPFPWPRSILSLIAASFALVSLPLLYVVMSTVFSVDQLTKVSQKTLYQSVSLTQTIRLMSDDLVQMERAYRQYLVLNDDLLLQRFQATHEHFLESVQLLAQTNANFRPQATFGAIVQREQLLFDALMQAKVKADIDPIVEKEFADLTALGHALVEESSSKVTLAVDALQQEGDVLQQSLFMKAIFMIPTTILLALLFALLITRPVQQLMSAIRRMGDGDLAVPVSVSGPADLRLLGERLNWLRVRLLDLEQEKQKFLRSVSHELNTPLSAIREGTALLAEGVVGPINGQQSEVLDILRSSGLDLQRHIENLLHFNRLQAQGAKLYCRELDLQPLVQEVTQHHKVSMLAKNLQLELDLHSVLVEADDEKLRVIFDNLISNAVKYSPANGTIFLRLRQEAGKALLSVIDEGSGVSLEEQDKVFEGFYRGAAAREGKIKGTGLGLVIAQEYAHAHGGEIHIQSPVQNGVGSLF